MINRSVFLLEMRTPFLDWLNSLEEEREEHYTLEEINNDLPAFLIPESYEPLDARAFCHKNLEEIFYYVLESWCRDESKWIKDYSLESFDKHFKVLQGEIVFDLGKGSITKEDY